MARYDSYGAVDDKQNEAFDAEFVGFNNRLGPDNLKSGMFVDAKNFRFDLAGKAQVRKGIDVVKAPLALDSNNAFTLDFYLYANVTASAVTTSTNKLTIDFGSDHGIVDDTLVSVSAIGGLSNYTAGNFLANKVDDNTIEITVTGVSGSASSLPVVGAPRLASSFTTQIHGSCNYSDFFNDGVEYIILAGNDKAYAINLDTRASTTIAYPAGVQVSSKCNVLQGLNKVFIFRDGLTALEFDGDLSSSPAFTKVPSGAFTQPVTLDSANNTVISNGKVTISETSHGLISGDPIVIVASNTDSGNKSLERGSTFNVTKINDNSFYFFADVDDSSAYTGKYLGTTSVGEGFIRMPAPPYGVVHSNRLVVPFFYTVDASSDSFTARNVDDDILISHAFRDSKYDTPYVKTRTTEGGVNDKLVGIFSFADDKLLLLNRKSIYFISGIDNPASDRVRQKITSEVGLLAKDSVVQVGNQIIFLSDNGVYGMSFEDLYNLRGNEVPMSESIDETISRINQEYAHNSVAVYFNNRYYLAVPLDNSTENNAILVFNFLNKAWESIDNVGSTSTGGTSIDFTINNLIVAGSGNDRAVYAINDLGGVHKLDAIEGTYDVVNVQVGQSNQNVFIPSELKTRQYNLNSIDRKKWNSFEMQLQSADDISSNFSLEAITENIDKTVPLGTLSTYNGGSELTAGEDVSIRGRIGNLRGYGLQFRIHSITGRPKFKIIKTTGAFTFKSTERAI